MTQHFSTWFWTDWVYIPSMHQGGPGWSRRFSPLLGGPQCVPKPAETHSLWGLGASLGSPPSGTDWTSAASSGRGVQLPCRDSSPGPPGSESCFSLWPRVQVREHRAALHHIVFLTMMIRYSSSRPALSLIYSKQTRYTKLITSCWGNFSQEAFKGLKTTHLPAFKGMRLKRAGFTQTSWF